MIASNRPICANRILELIHVSAPEAGEGTVRLNSVEASRVYL
jgi:hypothetical protein